MYVLEFFGILLTFIAGLYATFYIVRWGIGKVAEKDRWFTYPEENKIKTLMLGEEIVKFIYVRSGVSVMLDRNHNTAPIEYKVIYDPQDPEQDLKKKRKILNPKFIEPPPPEKLVDRLLLKYFGVERVGFYPYKIHTYDFTYDRMARPNDSDKIVKEGYKFESFKDEIHVVHRTSKTEFLFLVQALPLLALNLETKDRVKIDIIGMMHLQAVDAYKPIFGLRGDWYTQIHGAATGQLTDFIRTLTYQQVTEELEMKKVFWDHVVNKTDFVQEISGIDIIDFVFIDWRPSPRDPEIEKASKLKAQYELEGDAKIARAERDAKAFDLDTIARARRIELEGAKTAEATEKLVRAAAKVTGGIQLRQTTEIANALANTKARVVSLGSNATILPLDAGPEDATPTETSPSNNPDQPTQGGGTVQKALSPTPQPPQKQRQEKRGKQRARPKN
jgi:hypothetical protein